MHVCMYYVCMYVRYSASRSLFGALIGALGDMDVSPVEYACIINVCIYRRADSTGSTIYVCMHACMYVLCMCDIWCGLAGSLIPVRLWVCTCVS